MRHPFLPLLCPDTHLDALDAEALIRRVMRTVLHAPVAWPLLREAMAYRCDPVSGVAAAEGLADAVTLWQQSGRRPPRLRAPSDPDVAPDERAAIGVLAALQARRPRLAAARLEWLFPSHAATAARTVWTAAAGNLEAAGLHLDGAGTRAAAPASAGRPRLAGLA